jgi:hypothetical protein
MWLWTLQRACDAAAAGPMKALSSPVLAQTVREAGPFERAVCDKVFASLLRQVEPLGRRGGAIA